MIFHNGGIDLDWEYDYPFALVMTVPVAVLPLMFFKGKKWR
jgi:hypothetical protein